MNLRRTLSAILLAVVLVFGVMSNLSSTGADRRSRGQQKPSPHTTPGPRTQPKPQQLFVGFWRVDLGFESTLRIKNIMVTEGLSVSPVIFMADGTEYDLPTVALPPAGIANLSVNQALAAAPISVRGNVSNFGSVILRFTARSALNAAASLQVLDEPRSLVFVNSSRPMTRTVTPTAEQKLESLWWKRDPGVRSFVAISSTSDAPREITLVVSGSSGSMRSQSLTLNGRNTAVIDLEPAIHELPEAEQGTGGVRLSYEGPSGDVFATLGLENPSEGYSASNEFQPRPSMGSMPKSELSFGSVGLMVGAPDPMMNFPHSTRFSVYAALLNSSDHELNVKATAFLMQGSQPRRVELPEQHLVANEARQLSLGPAFSNFNGIATLTLSYEGHPGELLMATGSVDQTGTYVFEVVPDGLDRSWAKSMPFWSLAGGFDSMVTVFNPEDVPSDLMFSLSYAGGTGHYSLPLHLAPGESRMIDIGELVSAQQPDPQGNIIPRDTTEGSAQIASVDGIAEWIRVGISGGVFNVQTATCGGGCKICTTTTDAFITPNPIVNQVGTSQQASALVDLADGSELDKTLSAQWGSSNTSVATVQAGLVSGIAAGSATISARFQAPTASEPLPEGCASSCPMDTFFLQASAPVLPVINSISPAQGLIGATTSSVTFMGRGLNGATVVGGPGITATAKSSNDTTLVVDLAVAANASAGNHSISVSNGGQTSNALNFFVQVPTSLSIVSGTNSTTPEASCSAGSFGTGCGVTRSFMYQVYDQNSPPQPIQAGSVQVWDEIHTTSPNNLGITGYLTTCSPTQTNSGPCGVTTNSLGQFGENNPGLPVCSTVCRVNNACTTGGPTNADQTVHVGSNTIVQHISYFCDHVLVNSQ